MQGVFCDTLLHVIASHRRLIKLRQLGLVRISPGSCLVHVSILRIFLYRKAFSPELHMIVLRVPLCALSNLLIPLGCIFQLDGLFFREEEWVFLHHHAGLADVLRIRPLSFRICLIHRLRLAKDVWLTGTAH